MRRGINLYFLITKYETRKHKRERERKVNEKEEIQSNGLVGELKNLI
jgi:hypothetical protein